MNNSIIYVSAGCKNFGPATSSGKNDEMPECMIVEFDGFDPPLHKITLFPLLLWIYSAYAFANREALKIAFLTLIYVVV